MANVKLITYTPNPEKTIAIAAKLCYSSSTIEELSDNLTDDSVTKFVNMLGEIGHESPIEHASFTFAVEGVSRTFLAQITRHRIGSYSVQSQRYVKEKDFGYVIPPQIDGNDEATNLFKEAMKSCDEYYQKLTDILYKKHYQDMIQKGIDEKSAKSKAEKKAIEDARFVLPNACETKMIVTMNARSLHNFFRLRCCNRAQWEIRDVANKMLGEVIKVAPNLFKNAGPSCVSGNCNEGKMTCGEIKKVREYYKNLRGE